MAGCRLMTQSSIGPSKFASWTHIYAVRLQSLVFSKSHKPGRSSRRHRHCVLPDDLGIAPSPRWKVSNVLWWTKCPLGNTAVTGVGPAFFKTREAAEQAIKDIIVCVMK